MKLNLKIWIIQKKNFLQMQERKMADWIYNNVVPNIVNKIEIGWGGIFFK